MIRDVYLHGAPGRTFGRHFRLDVSSPAEAVRALIMLRPGLRTRLREGWWRVIVGSPHISNAVPVDYILMTMGNQPLHIVPATRPAGGDVGEIVVGTVLVAAAVALVVFAPYVAAALGAASATIVGAGVSVGLTGVSMVAGGIAGLLTSPPTARTPTANAAPADQPSFLFNGVTNNSQQGSPVPLVFGTHLVGSIVVAAGLNSEDIAP
jgi:predicted phage tail protein